MLAALAAAATLIVQADSPVEVRGVWIPSSRSTFFDSRESVRDQMQILADAGVNVVFPAVWSEGYTLFDSAIAAEVVGARKDPRYADRDPLAEVLFEAHRHGIEVVPWFEYGFAAGHETFPGRALHTHSEWTAIGVDGDPVVEGGYEWMNALDPDVQKFMTALVTECARNYDVDGVQGSERLPALPAEAGYDDRTIAFYRGQRGSDPPEDIHDPAWTRWRADLLTAYLGTLRREVKEISGDLVVSMAPGRPGRPLRDGLQDRQAWVEQGLIDALHPRFDARDLDAYVRAADGYLDTDWLRERRALIAPGVLASSGQYRVANDVAVGAIAFHRERGVAGEVWFDVNAFVRDDGALASALAAGPYRERARLPWRNTTNWRPVELLGAPIDIDGTTTWTAVPAVDGIYTIWVQETAEAQADESTSEPNAGAPGPGWRALGSKRLVAGQTNDLLRATPEVAETVTSVRAIVDRRADRQ